MIRPVPKVLPQRDEAFRAWIRQQPCLLADREPCECGRYHHIGSNRQAVECCHIRVRRHGDVANLWPGCTKHHREQHTLGIKSFAAKYAINWREVGQRYWERYTTEHQEAA